MKPKISTNSIIFINSVSYGLLAAITVLLLNYFLVSLTSNIFGYSTYIFSGNIYFNIVTSEWTNSLVKLLYSLPLIYYLIIAILFTVLFRKTFEYNGYLRIFVTWGMIFSYSLFVGTIMFGTLFYSSFGIVLEYLYLNITIKLIIFASCFLVFLLISRYLQNSLLLTANIYYTNLHQDNFEKYYFYSYLLPFLIIGFLIFLIFLKTSFYNNLLNLTPLLIIIPLFFFNKQKNNLFFEAEIIKPKIKILPILLSIIIGIFAHIILHKNIYFP